jgi:hypothetical protein
MIGAVRAMTRDAGQCEELGQASEPLAIVEPLLLDL